jgi:hypothetical protein
MNSIEAFAAASSGNERATARNEQWYVETRAGIQPMTAHAIEESLQRGALQVSTKVWKSGMQAWQPLGSIAYFSPRYDQPARAAASEAPLPALSEFDWGPDSRSEAAAPVYTLIRPIALKRRAARAPAKPPRPSREQADARRPSRLRHPETWHIVLLSAIAGTALGLAVYHPLLWRAPEPALPSLAPAANAPQPAAVPLVAALPAPAPPVPQAAARDAAQASAASSEHSASALTQLASELPTPQAKRTHSQRRKPTARRHPPRTERTELPAWP